MNARTTLTDRTDNGITRSAIVVSEGSATSLDVVARDGTPIMRLNIMATDTPWANIDVIPLHPTLVSRAQSSKTAKGEKATNETSGMMALADNRALYSIDFVQRPVNKLGLPG